MFQKPILGTSYVPSRSAGQPGPLTLYSPRKVTDIVYQSDGSYMVHFECYGGECQQSSADWAAWLSATGARPLNTDTLAALRGREDYRQGRAFRECPYRPGNSLRIIWQDAWTTAAEEAAEQAA